MVTNRLFGTILDSALWEYASLGFHLERLGANILELYFKDKKITSYNRDTVTVEIIHRDCKRFISRTARGIIYHDRSHKESE